MSSDYSKYPPPPPYNSEPQGAPMGYNGPQGSQMGYNGPQESQMGYNGPQGSQMGYNGPQGSQMGYNGPQGSQMGYNGPQGSQMGFGSPQQSVQIVNNSPQPQVGPSVVYVAGGSCPNCRAGFFVEEFNCCGIFLAICFFPLGLICCFVMRDRKCNNCGFTIS